MHLTDAAMSAFLDVTPQSMCWYHPRLPLHLLPSFRRQIPRILATGPRDSKAFTSTELLQLRRIDQCVTTIPHSTPSLVRC